MSLIVVRMSGHVYNSNTAGTVVEEWSCSLSLIGPLSPDPSDYLAGISSACQAWFTNSDTGIDATAALEVVSVNEVDPITGHQVNDPTIEDVLDTPVRGALTPSVRQPLVNTYRVSLDSGVRSRRTKGGFYVPRVAFETQANGRLDPGDVGGAVEAAKSFLDAINDVDPSIAVGVWSRAGNSVTASTGVRVGDRADVIRRRSNEVIETYSRLPLA